MTQFSLILATKNRVREVERFLQSLAAQTYKNFELVLVDQNADNRLVELVNIYGQKFPILHLKQAKSGVSRGRNLGRLYVKGDFVAFPDDDSVYPPDVLSQVVEFFQQNSTWDGVIGRVYDLEADQNAFLYCGDEHSGSVDLERAFRIGITHGMFYRASMVKEIVFDETMGPGAGTSWGCGDDVDYLFQCIQVGYKIYYNATIIVRHPNPFNIYNFRQLVRREYHYGRGNGYLIGHYFPPSFVRTEILQNVPYVFVTLFKGQFNYCAYIIATVLGMSLGYWDSLIRRREIKPSTVGEVL
ncbi:MAG: glycosyltransferase family 2 protein [Limnoraphis sp. WC205]|jgi:glycosyltransferase involved in cell wall biosynthesis|nr:glycosyltransferase family 2 protein [Limnoraphis sp. WC205]